MFNKLFKLFNLVVILLLGSNALAENVKYDQTNPYILTEQISAQIFPRIKKDQAIIQKNPDYLRKIVEEYLMPFVQVKYAGFTILGKYLTSASKAEQDRFLQALDKLIVRSYATILTQYKNQQIKLEKPKPLGDKKFVTIRTTVIQGQNAPTINLDFKWRKNTKTGLWQAYDMLAENISMIATKQAEWADTLANGGLSKLTDEIEQINKQPITIVK